MNKCWYLILFILFMSCGIQSKYPQKNNPSDYNVQLHANVYKISADSLLIKTFISLPVSNLVFIKEDKGFSSSLEIMIRIEDNNSGLQIDRISDNKEIVKQYYEDTRLDDSYQLGYQFLLEKGDYKLITSIKDLDSFNTWDNSLNIELDSEKINLIAPYYYDNELKQYIHNEPIYDIHKIWFELPRYNFDKAEYEYTIIQDDKTLAADIIKDCKDNELLLECPIELSQNIIGDIEFHIKSNLKDSFTSLISIYDDSSLWSGDIDIILGVMSYILSYSEIRTLYDLDEKRQRIFVADYLDSKDPNLDTEKNELIEIIKKRYKYTNDNFSEYLTGWSTDRGETYIVYGPPQSIESMVSQPNHNSHRNEIFDIEKWYYSNKVFIFSNERTFGEMQLTKQF